MLGTALSLLIAGWSQTATPTQAKPSTSVHDVPVEVHGGYFFVRAKINGLNVKLLFDTGATHTTLSTPIAKKLGLVDGQNVEVVGVGSAKVSSRWQKLKKLEVGGKTVRDEIILVTEFPPILKCDGILGSHSLKAFTVGISFDSKRLALYPTSEAPKLPKAKTFEMTIINQWPTIPGRIAGIPGHIMLDTGSGDGMTVAKPFVEKYDLRKRYNGGDITKTGI